MVGFFFFLNCKPLNCPFSFTVTLNLYAVTVKFMLRCYYYIIIPVYYSMVNRFIKSVNFIPTICTVWFIFEKALFRHVSLSLPSISLISFETTALEMNLF